MTDEETGERDRETGREIRKEVQRERNREKKGEGEMDRGTDPNQVIRKSYCDKDMIFLRSTLKTD